MAMMAAARQVDREEEESSEQAEGLCFEALARRHHERLYSFIYRYVGNEADAEDLTQDTLVKAYRFFDRYDPARPFVAWLLTIGRRTVYNHFRARRAQVELEEESMADDREGPDSAAEQKDRAKTVWDAVGRLKPRYREALELRYKEDLSVKEIAQVLHTSQANVKILLFRGRGMLRRIYENSEEVAT